MSAGEPVSFECILSAVNDMRSANFSATTIRKVIKQVDNALASVAGDDADISIAVAQGGDLESLCDQVEASCQPSEVSALGVSPLLASLLIALLKAALEKFAG